METLRNITWFGHASFLFIDQASGKRIYYIDPFDLPDPPAPIESEPAGGPLEKADLLFITHTHPDHCSPDDVKKIMTENTCVIAPIDCLENLRVPQNQQFPVLPQQQYTVQNFTFTTLPAYNDRPNAFHPKENNWVGYVFTINGKKIYHAGDTDMIPEMETLSHLHLDIAMLPMGGTYTMNTEEMAKAANLIAAKYTVPMHYRRLLGERYKQAEEQLKKLVTNSEVVILKELR